MSRQNAICDIKRFKEASIGRQLWSIHINNNPVLDGQMIWLWCFFNSDEFHSEWRTGMCDTSRSNRGKTGERSSADNLHGSSQEDHQNRVYCGNHPSWSVSSELEIHDRPSRMALRQGKGREHYVLGPCQTLYMQMYHIIIGRIVILYDFGTLFGLLESLRFMDSKDLHFFLQKLYYGWFFLKNWMSQDRSFDQKWQRAHLVLPADWSCIHASVAQTKVNQRSTRIWNRTEPCQRHE